MNRYKIDERSALGRLAEAILEEEFDALDVGAQ